MPILYHYIEKNTSSNCQRRKVSNNNLVQKAARKKLKLSTGGWINTSRHGDGILHEHGPRTIRPAGLAGANTLELAEELGLSDKIIPIVSGHPATKNR